MIPFTQYLLPNGRRSHIEIERPADIEAMAERFMRSGGRFECEVLRDLETVSLTAARKVDGEDQDIAIELCKNGPDVVDAVDQLVRNAAAYIDMETIQ